MVEKINTFSLHFKLNSEIHELFEIEGIRRTNSILSPEMFNPVSIERNVIKNIKLLKT